MDKIKFIVLDIFTDQEMGFFFMFLYKVRNNFTDILRYVLSVRSGVCYLNKKGSTCTFAVSVN